MNKNKINVLEAWNEYVESYNQTQELSERLSIVIMKAVDAGERRKPLARMLDVTHAAIQWRYKRAKELQHG